MRHSPMRLRFNLVIEILLISRRRDSHTSLPLCRFNLVIEILLISSQNFTLKAHLGYCFNLVIEILLISSVAMPRASCAFSCFNLVIEILLISSFMVAYSYWTPSPRAAEFQSRNRDTFDFKIAAWEHIQDTLPEFQSRNRDTFDFKGNSRTTPDSCQRRFQSRNRDTFDFKPTVASCGIIDMYRFNLVIEILLISSTYSPEMSGRYQFRVRFQSRNRDTFDFKTSKA